jgi:hypothetical protein
MTSQNSVDVLIGSECNPKSTVKQSDIKKMRMSTITVRGNYRQLKEYVIDIGSSGLIIVDDEDDYSKQMAEFYRHLHNYLSSLYSFNEQVENIIEEYSSIEELSLVPNGDTRYTRKLAFVRGLRISAQHGDYSCLDISPIKNCSHSTVDDNAIAYQVKFVRDGFEDSAVQGRSMYESYTDYNDRKWPIQYISAFYETYFDSFQKDLFNWLNR